MSSQGGNTAKTDLQYTVYRSQQMLYDPIIGKNRAKSAKMGGGEI